MESRRKDAQNQIRWQTREEQMEEFTFSVAKNKKNEKRPRENWPEVLIGMLVSV